VASSTLRAAACALLPFVLACSSHKVSIEVGGIAPSISLTAATRAGVLPDPLRLENFRGQTVVLAFFYKARTPG
jgi:peroxiredoxin Q/BCP